MKGSFWGNVIGFVGVPLLLIWGAHKLVMWALLAIGASVWLADKVALLASLGVIVFLIVLRFKPSGGPAMGKPSQTTQTGRKVTDYVFDFLTTEKVRWFWHRHLFLTNPDAGTLILGGAGAGKSKSLIEPIIDEAIEKGFTGILYDFKYPELAEIAQTAIDRNTSSVKSYVVNFDDLDQSNRVNPISPALLHTSSHARTAAQTVIKNLFPPSQGGDNFFVKNATTYLTGIIWFLKEEHPELCTLPHAIALANEPVSKVVALLASNREVAGTIASIRTAVEEKAGGQLAAVVATLQDSLSVLNTPKIAWVLTGNDFTLDLNNPKEPKFLTLGNNRKLKGAYSPILALITTVALGEMNAKGKSRSIVILDEAPTLYIPDFSEIPATARGARVASIFCAQDISQIVSMYGEQEKDAILANLANKFYGRVNHPQTAQYIASMWGKEQVLQRSQSISDAPEHSMTRQKSHQISITDRDRIQIQEVLELETGEFFGQLIESDVSYFRAKMKPKPLVSTPLKVIKEVSDEQVKTNFNTIYQSISDLFNSQPTKLQQALKPEPKPIPPAPERSEKAAKSVNGSAKNLNGMTDEF